ncbi:MAG: hypothetical protein ABSA02_14865 [Trebonia sp.]|jgi:hypothetical protein
MDADGLVVHDGGLVTASGRLVRDRAGDWLEPRAMVAAVGGPRVIRPPGPAAVRVAGADFGDLAGRFENAGAVEGFATLTGLWSAGQLLVQEQTASTPGEARVPRWVTPPGLPPAGGWPPGRLRFDMNDVRDIAAVVAVTVFRPAPEQEVLVVAATDPAAVEALLGPRLGARLRVVPSRWTKAELDTARGHLQARHRSWGILRLGQSADGDGQAYIAVDLARVLPEIALWAASIPTGIVSLNPWLRPAHAQPASL